MHGDFSRRTFDAADRYRAVLLQQGRVVLDSDLNEQAEITTHHDEARLRDLVGRSGGPAPASDAPGPFALVGPSSTAADGWRFNAEAWADLRLTGGTYYVDGVLVEGLDPPAGGYRLADQPFLPAVTVDGVQDPGLPEPADDGRYAAYLDVWQRQVTFDEDPSLLESALGGPDTTTRSQTVWQVRLFPAGAGVRCSDLHTQAAEPRDPRRMAAELAPPDATADPCEISAVGGYQRLENQLYRVQVHDAPDPVSATAPDGTVLWSRDNGCVVAGIGALAVVDATDAVLTLDRLGRDDESSLGAGRLVEVTSRDRELRGLPGFLADTGTPDGFDLPVTWRGTGPASLAAVGGVPIARRWDGGPLPITPAATLLEGGVRVRFPAGGEARTGDYWQIPARTVRLAYGLTQVSGAIEWPPRIGDDVEQPPAGPEHHVSPLGILERAGGLWSLESDCRLLFPALTDLVTIDEVGGDGQEAMPGDPLPHRIRVAVRNGGVLLHGAAVTFEASDGGRLADSGPPTAADQSTLVGTTGADGVAAVRWLLDPSGPTTQTVTVRRLDDHAQPVDVPVVVTGRLSVAREVAWDPDPDCPRFAGTRTVQDALTALVERRELRLLGGDGQTVSEVGEVVQRPVRVVVDDGCGPVGGATVQVLAGNEFTGFGRVAPAREGDLAPATLEGTGATERAEVTTDRDGVAAVWWQPAFGNVRWATLDAVLERSGDAPVRVTANLHPGGGGGRTPGLHIRDLRLGGELPFTNDATIGVRELATGITVFLDGPVAVESVLDKPVIHVELDLPYPIGIERDMWGSGPIGTRTVTLDGTLRPGGASIHWVPRPEAQAWLLERLFPVLADVEVKAVLGRYVLDGWAIVAEEDPRRHVNTHANTVVLAAVGRTLFDLPTDDEITGGQFVQWFHLMRDVERIRANPPAVVGRTAAVAQRELEAAGLVVSVGTEPSPDVRRGLVVRTEPEVGTFLEVGARVQIVVSSGRAG
jgi:Family of unknown function (DUF6519)/PASTA domain